MVIDKAKLSPDQLETFYASVAEDFGRHGKTEKKCPTCGKSFIFKRIGNSYELKCETSGCYEEQFRGL